jgi:beta-lactamase regulating signal transducer with metallopeptidase domain
MSPTLRVLYKNCPILKMTNVLTAIANQLFGWAAITTALCLFLATIYPLFYRILAKLSAGHAASFTLLYGLLAPAAGILALILLALPQLSFPFVADHCHNHICAPHTLHITTDTIEGIIAVAIVVLLLTGIAVVMATQILRNRQRLKTLSALSEPRSAHYRLVESDDHVAWCAGLWKPQIYLSRGLVESLNPSQMRMVLAHEEMHLVRRDNLRKWLLHWATLVWPKKSKARIRLALSNYCELSCDLAAIQVNYEPSELHTFADILQRCCATTRGEGSNAHQHRIYALEQQLAIQASKASGVLTPFVYTAGLWLFVVILAIHFGHPLLEWLSQ